MIKIIFLVFLVVNLCGFFLTSRVVREFGIEQGTIDRAVRISTSGDDYLVEFHARHAYYKHGEIFFWKRISRDSMFSVSEQNVAKWKPKPGHIPGDNWNQVQGMPKCISAQHSAEWIEFNDYCAQKKTRLGIGKEYVYKSPWRPVLLPVLVPVACAADILISPILAVYVAKCLAFGCRK